MRAGVGVYQQKSDSYPFRSGEGARRGEEEEANITPTAYRLIRETNLLTFHISQPIFLIVCAQYRKRSVCILRLLFLHPVKPNNKTFKFFGVPISCTCITTEKCFMNLHFDYFQAEVIAPSEELLNNQVVNDFDIEEEEIEIENRLITLSFDFFPI